jgi:hypothetical protein
MGKRNEMKIYYAFAGTCTLRPTAVLMRYTSRGGNLGEDINAM